MKFSETDEYSVHSDYKGPDPIVSLIASQINRIMEHRTNSDYVGIIASIDALIDLLPPEIEEVVTTYMKEHNIVYDISISSKDDWIKLNRFIKKQLAQQNILWKRSHYEKGSES